MQNDDQWFPHELRNESGTVLLCFLAKRFGIDGPLLPWLRTPVVVPQMMAVSRWLLVVPA